MKKNSMLIIVLVVIISMFSGCNNNGVTGNNSVNNDTSSSSENTTQESTSQKADESVNGNNEQTTGSELSGLIQKIYEIKDAGLMLGDIPVDLSNTDSLKYYTGLSDSSKVKDVVASEAMIGSQAYSLVLVQLNNAEDAGTVEKEMLNGIDKRKWICVEADDLQIVTQDDLIMLIMVSSELKDSVTSQEIVDAFKKVTQ